jgi:uncharacterized protein (DUF952 family)
MQDEIAYKILTQAQFAALQAGAFAGAPVDVADGYVHLSTAAQVTETVDKHFAGQAGQAGQAGLVVAAVDLARLGTALRWEVSRGGALFPHLYGALTMDCVTAHGPLTRDAQGQVILPA